MEWISVKDRLPEDSEEILLYFSEEDVCDVGYYTAFDIEDGEEDVNCFEGSLYDSDVTHWMPLPAPPKDPNG